MVSDVLDYISEAFDMTLAEFEARLDELRTQPEQYPTAPTEDVVNHPKHYCQGSIELIDFMDDWQLDFYQATILQYLLRHKQKGGVQDLEKAMWYLTRYIKRGGK